MTMPAAEDSPSPLPIDELGRAAFVAAQLVRDNPRAVPFRRGRPGRSRGCRRPT